MSSAAQRVPLQRISPWSSHSILGPHLGTTDYLLPPKDHEEARPSSEYETNEDVWRAVVDQRVLPGSNLTLSGFHLMDWFPRAPGLYHTPYAEDARRDAHHYLDESFGDSPVRDHAKMLGEQRTSPDHTVVFTPMGKTAMLEGGIGCIRLKPIPINGQPHWLTTATSNGVVHEGIPLAVPQEMYGSLLPQIHEHGGVGAFIHGELDFLPDPFSRLFDWAVMVPRLYVRATRVSGLKPPSVPLEASVAVSFVSEFETRGDPGVYASYVTFRPDVEGSFEDATSWLKTEYVEGAYEGRIITDFDQTRTVFPEARLALSRVMDRLVTRGEIRETIELMHASAAVERYFDEVDRLELAPSGHSLQRRNKIFISYAHSPEKETGWVRRIQTHLQGLAHSSDFEVWADTEIEPGQRWRKQIERAIEETRVAVLILTADFLASPFIREAELPPLLEAADADGAKILCVYGSHVHLSGVAQRLSQYQFVNEIEKPLQALLEPEREAVYMKLAAAVEKAISHQDPG